MIFFSNTLDNNTLENNTLKINFQNTSASFSPLDSSSPSLEQQDTNININVKNNKHPHCSDLEATSFFLHVTPKAQEKIRFYQECLHLAIAPGGCSGLKTIFHFKPPVNIKDLSSELSHSPEQQKQDHSPKINPLKHLLFFFPEKEDSSLLQGFTANEYLLETQPTEDNNRNQDNTPSKPSMSSTCSTPPKEFHDSSTFSPPSPHVCVWVDGNSAALVHGAHLDYIEEIMNQYFALYHPKATNQCGCKVSFAL